MKLLIRRMVYPGRRGLGHRGILPGVLLCLSACVGSGLEPRSEDVAVARFGTTSSVSTAHIKRQQLAAEIMRYADRYSGRMAIESQQLDQQATTAELRWFASGWNVASQKAVLDISIGPNAVENLLDMLVFATLTRIELEGYWVPQYLGDELGKGLLHAARGLEQDIWGLSGQVLTTDQQNDLRDMIRQWKDDNPDQHYFWFVRFSGFSGQRAEAIAHLEQSGGLLGEMQLARETAAEIQAFSERLLHYLQRSPGITRLEAEFGVRGLLRTPEISRWMDDVTRASESSERYAEFAEKFPELSKAFMDDLMAKLSRERQLAILQMQEAIAQEREAALRQMYAGLLTERTAAIDQLAEAEREVMRQLLSSPEFLSTLDRLGDEGGEIANKTFVRGVLLIVIWVVAYVGGKLAYDRIATRLAASRPRVRS